jgi:hypothetical protein
MKSREPKQALELATGTVTVRKTMCAKFGYDRLGANPHVLLKKVSKRGRIVSDTETGAVREFVANLRNEGVVGSRDIRRLAEILDTVGFQATRAGARVGPPHHIQ